MNLLKNRISLFNNCYKTEPTRTVEYEHFFSMIKNGIYEFDNKCFDIRKQVQQARAILSEKGKEAYSSFKKSLSAVTFSAELTSRKNNLKIDDKLISYNPIIQVDIDDHEGDINELKSQLEKDPHIFFVFISISGKGLKAGLYIYNFTASQHNEPKSNKEAYEQIERYFKDTYNVLIDTAVKDLSRLCFISYDPDIRVNPNVKPFNIESSKKEIPVDKDESKQSHKQVTYRAEDVDNIKYEVSMGLAHDPDGKRHAMRYTHGLKIGTLIAQGLIDDSYRHRFDEQIRSNTNKPFEEAKQNFINGVDQATFNFKNDVGVSKDQLSKRKVNRGGLPFCFWKIDSKGKVIINPSEILDLLKERGFCWAKFEGLKLRQLVKIDMNIIDIVDLNMIQEYLSVQCFDELPEMVSKNVSKSKVKDAFINVLKKFVNKEVLNALGTKQIKLLRDSKFKVYRTYLNGVCIVTASSKKIISYEEINGYFLRDHVIKRNLRILDEKSEIEGSYSNNEYHLFKKMICTSITDSGDEVFEEERKRNLDTAMGYLSSSNHDPTNNKAINISEDNFTGNPEGRTGKSLLSKSQMYFLDHHHLKSYVHILDGKNLNEGGKFKFQELSLFTRLIAFDDVKEDFDLESHFSIISNGIPIEYKYGHKVTLPFDLSPKLMITSNYPIKGSSGSHKARKHNVEITNYFSSEHDLKKVFKRTLFDDWDSEDWNTFDNIKLQEIQDFLKYGLIEFQSSTLIRRQLFADVGEDLVNFIESNEMHDELFIKNDLKQKLEWDQINFKSKELYKRLDNYCRIKGYYLYEDRVRLEGHQSPQYVIKIDTNKTYKSRRKK